MGDAIAVVVAKTEEIAVAAIKKITVDYKVFPPVLTMEDALKVDAPKIHAEGNVLGRETSAPRRRPERHA